MNGCEIMNCKHYVDGVCQKDGDCIYQEEEIELFNQRCTNIGCAFNTDSICKSEGTTNKTCMGYFK
jgi:hypothetical protein